MPSSNTLEGNNNISPPSTTSSFSRLASAFRICNRFSRPQRPSSSRSTNGITGIRGNTDLIANLEGNRAFQSSKSFVTQGIILPVNIDKSSLSIIKKSELELEVSGKFDSNVRCQIYAQSDSWKEKCTSTIFSDGLSQEFSLIIPNFASFGPKYIDLIISEVFPDSQSASKVSKQDKFLNPFYVHEQFTKISLSRNENGGVFLKADDQYIKLRNKNFSLLEIFGKPLSSIRSTASSPTSYCSDGLSNRECIVCMSELKDTIVLPCRHMCLCSECANTIRGRSDKCPLCRQGKFIKLIFILIILGFRALLHIKYC